MSKIISETATGSVSFDVEEGRKLVLALEDNSVDILHRCGGNARCTTCRVEIIAGDAGEKTEDEIAILSTKEGLSDNTRLSCQIRIHGDLEVKVINQASVMGDRRGNATLKNKSRPLRGEMNMFDKLKGAFASELEIAEAHCDAPCGVYDPASARIAAEAVLSMTKKILDLKAPDGADEKATAAYHNTLTRYIVVKEQQAHAAKEELLILWTDYFKPVHLETYPNLHDTFWKAAKLCSAVKVEVSLEHATELIDAIKEIHAIFWATKGRDIAWYTT